MAFAVAKDLLDIKKLDDVPPFRVIATREGGKLGRFIGGQYSGFVVLDVSDTRAILLATRQAAGLGVRQEIEAAIKAAGYQHMQRGVIEPGTLSILISNHTSGVQAKSVHAQIAAVSDDAGMKADFIRMIDQAVVAGASDVHIETRADRTTIKFRVHGKLYKVSSDSASHNEAMLRSVYMTMADSGSKGKTFNAHNFQAATIEIELRDETQQKLTKNKYRLRYQSMPTHPSGYDVILRVLPTSKNMTATPFRNLGYSAWHEDQILSINSRREGVVILCGVTGSGKTTTLNNMILHYIRDNPGCKAFSIEQPPEYTMPGVSQIPVANLDDDPSAPNPFAEALRSVMRADPDLIMIGEIRDPYSADAAVGMAQSGHKVYSTTHVPSARGVPARLHGFHVDHSVLGSDDFLAGIIYQKLVTVMCKHCRIGYLDALKDGFIDPGLHARLCSLPDMRESDLREIYVNGEGCQHCEGRGTTGVTVCAEIIIPDFEMLNLIRESNYVGLFRYWRSLRLPNKDGSNMEGWTSFEHAIFKMRNGIVSPMDIEGSFGFLDLEMRREKQELAGRLSEHTEARVAA